MINVTTKSPDSIQNYLTQCKTYGGGTVLLAPGTYTLTSDIFIPSGVTLEGESRDTTIIDCNTDYSVKIIGDDVYSTGTISINDGSTTVVGVGTAWTIGMIGQSIWVGGSYYFITDVTDGTHLEIDYAYLGSNLSGITYVIATTVNNVTLRTITIQNSAGSAIDIQYCNNPILDDINAYDSGIGINILYTLYPQIISYTVYNGINLKVDNAVGIYIEYSSFDFSTSGNGAEISNVITSSIYNTNFNSNTLNGILVTDCSDLTIFDTNFNNNISSGINLDSNNYIFGFSTVSTNYNGIDGVRVVSNSDDISFSQLSSKYNTGYGINIINNTNENIILVGIVSLNNTAGNLNDGGTGTLKSTTVNILA